MMNDQDKSTSDKPIRMRYLIAMLIAGLDGLSPWTSFTFHLKPRSQKTTNLCQNIHSPTTRLFFI